MSTALFVLPWVDEEYQVACVGSMHPALRPDVLAIDNSVSNSGVARSWNIGAKTARVRGKDWLVVVSSAVRFGERGGLDFHAALVNAPDNVAVVEADAGLGWHLIGFRIETLDLVGPFDEHFWPAYYEDNDWSHRYQLATKIDSRAPGFVGPLWPKVPTTATLVETAHAITRQHITIDFVALERYYVTKWGGKSPHETYQHPFNNPALDWTYTGDPT